ncbi:MAG: glycosyltransferase [Bacteroidota bacterium]
MAFDSFYDGYLICVLNWGLGHATRCIPIIEKLLSENKRVIIASDGAALNLLKHEYPAINSYELPSYNVSYSNDTDQMFHLIKQLPKFAIARHKEHQAIEDIILKERVGYIISDNRYGCWHHDCKNYIIAHQLKPILTGKYKYFQLGLEILMMSLFSDFDEIWIPDDENIKLSGELSELRIEDKKYIGLLSRMKSIEEQKEYPFDVLFILSGPEPQRSNLEQLIIQQASSLKSLNCMLVKGIIGEIKEEMITETFKVVSWLDTEYLQDAINNSKYIVCRSGYSSIMDLAIIGKKAILIPTPGQSEQEYLAKGLHDKKIFYSCSQDQLKILNALHVIEEYTGYNPTLRKSSLSVLNKLYAMQESSIK